MLSCEIASELTGDTYRGLLRELARQADTIGFVVRQAPVSSRTESLLVRLSPHLKVDELKTEWPGTRLLGHRARVLHYASIPAVLETLLCETDRLFGWCAPELPEDIHIVDARGTVLLETVSHERLGMLRVIRDSDLVAQLLDAGVLQRHG